MTNPPVRGSLANDDPPPVFSTWPKAYAFVICYLAALIGVFYLFTAYFAP